jgi:hypothetical protein
MSALRKTYEDAKNPTYSVQITSCKLKNKRIYFLFYFYLQSIIYWNDGLFLFFLLIFFIILLFLFNFLILNLFLLIIN